MTNVNGRLDLKAIAGMVEDRSAEQAFKVDRRIFTAQEVFEAEVKHVFESTWNYIGLESQIPGPHDFFTTYIGRQPILVMRDGDGKIGAFLNTCRHRGTMVCPFKQGRQKIHVCRYHGWSFDSSGKNVGISSRQEGQYPDTFQQQDHNLLPVARFASYRGFMFASLSDDVPPLDEHLGEATVFLDLVIDQSDVGEVEYVAGSTTYTFDGNWKLQFENGLDYYHFASTHSSYVDVFRKRYSVEGARVGFTREPEGEAEGQGSFHFDHGHAVNWSIKMEQNYGRPLGLDDARLEKLRARVGDDKVKWMLRQRNLTIYPNMQLIDIISTQVRTWRPLSPGRTEIVSHCLAPVGETAEVRRMRIRNYEDFFGSAGLGSSDDNVMYEFCQSGYEAVSAGPTHGYARGLSALGHGENKYTRELGISPPEWAFGEPGFGGETNFYPGYREWKRLMEKAIVEDGQ